MIVFKPRLAAVYFIVAVIFMIVTNRLTFSSQKAVAVPMHTTNVETSK